MLIERYLGCRIPTDQLEICSEKKTVTPFLKRVYTRVEGPNFTPVEVAGRGRWSRFGGEKLMITVLSVKDMLRRSRQTNTQKRYALQQSLLKLCIMPIFLFSHPGDA